jgi:transcriptional regulator with XRE-family HTH domain
MSKPVSDIIKEAREKKDLTQTDVGKMIGVGLRQYQNIESGYFPKYKKEQVTKLESALGINIYSQIYDANGNLIAPETSDDPKDQIDGWEDANDIKEEEVQPNQPASKPALSNETLTLYKLVMDKLNSLEVSLEQSKEAILANSSLVHSVLINQAKEEARHVSGMTAKKIFEAAVNVAESIFEGLREGNSFDIQPALKKGTLE